jgi:hypothetical protein
LKALFWGRKLNVYDVAGLRLLGVLAHLLARDARSPTLAGNLLEKRQHFCGSAWRTTCSRIDLLWIPASRQTFRTSGGMPVSESDSVIAVRDLPSRLARSSCV